MMYRNILGNNCGLIRRRLFRCLIATIPALSLLLVLFRCLAVGNGLRSGTFTDNRDGQTYKTVRIGKKTWMAQNLNLQIGNSWCRGNNNSICDKYGRLYDWNTAMNACPTGWHLSTSKEWNALVNAVGGKNIAGKKLKSKNSWDDYIGEGSRNWGGSGNGTDDYEFSALPNGYRWYYYDGSFYRGGQSGYWWTAEESTHNYAYNRVMYYGDNYVSKTEDNKNYGFSVRCVKND
jgi:uncharacterized protein (TIGR02145 family)